MNPDAIKSIYEPAIKTTREEALKQVIEEARRLIATSPLQLVSFTIAMGTWFFRDVNNNIIHTGDWTTVYSKDGWEWQRVYQVTEGMEELDNFIVSLDEELKLSGEGIIVTASEIITDW